MTSTTQRKFGDICARISLNVPSRCAWCWDEVFGMALVVFDRGDMDLVYFPMTQEFEALWDIASIDRAPQHFRRHVNETFGIIPGQKIFTVTDAHTLFAVWWPWGDGAKISLRVGLLMPAGEVADQRLIKAQLVDWFRL